MEKEQINTDERYENEIKNVSTFIPFRVVS